MPTFDPDVVTAVLSHMNGDHRDDNTVIVRAFAHPDAESAVMVGLDGSAGMWEAAVPGGIREVRIPWAAEITERAQIRREVVELYRKACRRLGLDFREH